MTSNLTPSPKLSLFSRMSQYNYKTRQFQGRRESSGTLNTQYLRQALAEVASMQEFPCEDVRSISDVTIQSLDEDDVTQSNS
jgi:hypothetical protein